MRIEDLIYGSLEELEIVVSGALPRTLNVDGWETLRELCAGKMMRGDVPLDVRQRWARLALEIIDRQYVEADERKKVAEAAYIRAFMIREFGAGSSGPATDPAGLLRDVSDAIGVTIEEARNEAENWRSLEPARMLRLRRIKNMLTDTQGHGRVCEPRRPSPP
ncbi:hypothetical protein [Streptomyces odontomachi]|uniref:hypothetical protein n=1 Tax=Streptomyces odontomachi TaxID=2944940 RepID=UPI0021099B15|nr:hypothetical protein [Streptomyces sp. ODS25]